MRKLYVSERISASQVVAVRQATETAPDARITICMKRIRTHHNNASDPKPKQALTPHTKTHTTTTPPCKSKPQTLTITLAQLLYRTHHSMVVSNASVAGTDPNKNLNPKPQTKHTLTLATALLFLNLKP